MPSFLVQAVGGWTLGRARGCRSGPNKARSRESAAAYGSGGKGTKAAGRRAGCWRISDDRPAGMAARTGTHPPSVPEAGGHAISGACRPPRRLRDGFEKETEPATGAPCEPRLGHTRDEAFKRGQDACRNLAWANAFVPHSSRLGGKAACSLARAAGQKMLMLRVVAEPRRPRRLQRASRSRHCCGFHQAAF